MNSVSELSKNPMAFFPHDSTASSDIKCKRLIKRTGYEGYGRWWVMCEHLAVTDGHMAPFATEEDQLILGEVLGFSQGGFDEMIVVEDTRSFVAELVDVGLLEMDGDKNLFSRRMMQNSEYFGKKRAAGKKGGRPKKTA